MKYVIIIADGAADHPLEQLEGSTPFEVADIPHTDRLSMDGRIGTVATTPASFPCGSDVCCLSLLGYDPAKYHQGRAPLEAAALGIAVQETDWLFRLNLVTVVDGRMQDHSAGHITSEECHSLLEDLGQQLDLSGMTLHPGVSYRNILIDPSERDWTGLRTTPPHDIPGEVITRHLPRAAGSSPAVQHLPSLMQLIEGSERLLADHEINQTRREMGEAPATHLWPWGQGQRPSLTSFASRFGPCGAMITAVDLLAGLASLIGWERLDVPGQTSYHDTDYAAAGEHAIAALDTYELACVHIESPDEASHAADAETKVAAIEAIDQHVVGPIRTFLDRSDQAYRMLYVPDHYTSVATRKHDPTPVPFAICGTQVRSLREYRFSESEADESDLHVQYGHELMEYFLFSGLGEHRTRRTML